MSGPGHKGKKSSLVLFINGRLVECSPLKRGLDNTYAALYPRGYCPFVFLVSFWPDRAVLYGAQYSHTQMSFDSSSFAAYALEYMHVR